MSAITNGKRVLTCAFTCCPPAKPGFTGGEDVLGWNLLHQIARHHEVWAITNIEDQSSIEETLQEQSIPNLHFHYVGMPSWLQPFLKYQGGHQVYYYFWQIKAYFAARRLHHEHRFDMFHHITYANDWMASFIGAWLPIPYVRGPGGGAHRTPKDISKEYPFKGRLWERIRVLGQWLFRHDPFFITSQKRASAILLCNLDSVAMVPKKWSHKVHLFPVSGVATAELDMSTDEPDHKRRFCILSAGSLIRVKGFGLAIKAFKEFSDKHPESQLSIFGSGPEEPRLKELIQATHLQDKVNLIPTIPRDLLLSKMAASDVVLFPSMRDGGGTVVIEAMSVGKPVVCLDIGGPGMHITEECGIKIVPGSPNETVAALANALEQLYQDEDLRYRLGTAARHRAETMYHWDRLGSRLMEIYSPLFKD